MKRSIHAPKGDFNYKQNEPPIPEIGVCLDFLNKPTIGWDGKMSICNRYDPEGKGIIGDLNESTIEDIWNGEKRAKWLQHHKDGRRDLVPLCQDCTFWGDTDIMTIWKKKRKKRAPISEETRQKMKDAYRRRIELKEAKQRVDDNKPKDIREGLAKYLGL